MAAAYAAGDHPDWPLALEAGRKALALGYDTAALRTAMATAQYGRATLFRAAGRPDKADDAELDASTHLQRALELAPDDPAAARLMATQLIDQGRYREAAAALDHIAVQFPDDVDLQTQYATALSSQRGREEDAFVAWAHVWKLTNPQSVPLETSRYRRLAEGFDQHIYNVGMSAKQLSTGVAVGTLLQADAVAQMAKLKDDLDTSDAALQLMRPPTFDRNITVMQASRELAVSLMRQCLAAHQVYLETVQDSYRARALDLQRQAVLQLNAARTLAG